MEGQYQTLQIQLLTAVVAALILIIGALGYVGVSYLKRIQSLNELKQAETEAARKKLLDGQQEILHSVKNGAANTLAKRVLTAEDLHIQTKGLQNVNAGDTIPIKPESD